MKTREWLISQLEDGDILKGEVLEELLKSYVHLSDVSGAVADGETLPVAGKTVKTAIEAMKEQIVEAVGSMVEELLEEKLEELLTDYITSTGLSTAIADMATKTWVRSQLLLKADLTAVSEALAEKADAEDVSGLVTQSGLTAQLALKADASAVYSKTEADALLADKAGADTVYTKQQIDAVVASRPTQTELAGELAGIPNSAAIAEMRTALNAVIARTNKLSHVACGSETMQACLMDIEELEEPTTR